MSAELATAAASERVGGGLVFIRPAAVKAETERPDEARADRFIVINSFAASVCHGSRRGDQCCVIEACDV